MTNEERLKNLNTRELARELAAISGWEGNKEQVDFFEYWLMKEVENDK